MVNLIISSGNGFQTSDIIHGALPLHPFDPCLAVLLSVVYVRISTTGYLRRRRIFDEDENHPKLFRLEVVRRFPLCGGR